jgi:CspA family cold shock protein
MIMALGVVRSFDARRGSGLIAPDDGGADVFVHVSAVERAGLACLSAGERVSYDLQTDRALERTYAVNLTLV